MREDTAKGRRKIESLDARLPELYPPSSLASQLTFETPGMCVLCTRMLWEWVLWFFCSVVFLSSNDLRFMRVGGSATSALALTGGCSAARATFALGLSPVAHFGVPADRKRAEYHARRNQFERFRGVLELTSRFEFVFRRRENYIFWTIRIFGVFKGQSHTMWPSMCLFCGLFAHTIPFRMLWCLWRFMMTYIYVHFFEKYGNVYVYVHVYVHVPWSWK